jgi:hypothetical protein
VQVSDGSGSTMQTSTSSTGPGPVTVPLIPVVACAAAGRTKAAASATMARARANPEVPEALNGESLTNQPRTLQLRVRVELTFLAPKSRLALAKGKTARVKPFGAGQEADR